MDHDNIDVPIEDEDVEEAGGQGGLAIVIEPALLGNPEDVAFLQAMLWGNGQDEVDDAESEDEEEGEGDEQEGFSSDEQGDPGLEGDSGGSDSDEDMSITESSSESHETETTSEASEGELDSDDEYRRATSRQVWRQAGKLERHMSAGVSVDMPTAHQRGCLLHVLPDQCGAHECISRTVHFQTMDCLALVPLPRPAPAPQPGPQRTGGAAAPEQHRASPSQAAVGDTATAGSTSASAAGASAAGAAAGGGPSAAPSAPAVPVAEAEAAPDALLTREPGPDDDLEVLVGGPERLSICRVPAPGRPGELRVVCSVQLYSAHYSVAVSPDGRFVAAGGEGGFMYIFAYVRGGDAGAGAGASTSSSGRAGSGGAAAAAAAAAAAQGPGGQGAPQAAASLVRLAVFQFPVGTRQEPGMNNMLRFGLFGGALRLMVAVQDREIFLFNVPPWDGSAAGLARIAVPDAFCCPGLPRWSVSSWDSPPAGTGPNVPPQSDQQPQQQQQQQQQQPPQPASGQGVAAAGGSGTGSGEAGGPGTSASDNQPQWPNEWARRYWRRRWNWLQLRHPDINQEARTAFFSPLNANALDPGGLGPQGMGPLMLRAVPRTSAVTNFPAALNCAEGSPDGQWLAVGCDEPVVYLVPAGKDYSSRQASLLLVPLPREIPGRLSAGCQYVKFNQTSDRLAASFDALFSVYVFDVPRRQLLFSLRHQQWQPPLALSFAQAGPSRSLLLHATDRQHVVLVDVDAPSTTLTRLSIKPKGRRDSAAGGQEGAAAAGPPDPKVAQLEPQLEPQQQQQQEAQAGAAGEAEAEGAEGGGGDGGGDAGEGEGAAQQGQGLGQRLLLQQQRRRLRRPPHINGLVTTQDGRLLVATNTELLTFRLLLPGSPYFNRCRHHRHMPPGYKAAVRALLLSATPSPQAPTASAASASAAGPSASASSSGAIRADHAEEPSGTTGGPLGGTTGLWSLPADLLRHVLDATMGDWREWADTDVGDVLAFPTLKFWDGRRIRRKSSDSESDDDH